MGKDQELVQSIKANDVESFRKIIAKFKSKTKRASKKSSLHIVDHDGFIPLHHAALTGNGEIVMALLEFTTDVNVTDKKGMTPLHLAAWAGKVEPALLLLDAGAQTNLCSRSGATPLHLASEHGNYEVVERLVDHDCDPTVVNNHGETALDLACRFGHLEVVRILLNNSRGKCEKLLNPKEFQEKASPLHMAAKTGHFDVVKLLVECGGDINQRGPTGTCLHEAALYGKTDVVKFLVEAGIDVNLKNREGQTALDIVTQFTKSGASSEIKHVLREASVEVVYAKAIKDYANITDDTFLTLRLGDIVLVLDRRKDGLWKGCVRDDQQKERIGFFPSSVVQVLRPPSRNSVKRSSSCSSEASKASTVGTISNSVEIVTVAPPSQPVANIPRAPRMSSFRKKAVNKSQSESGDSKNGGRPHSELDVDEKKKKLNYLDIVVVEGHNKKSGSPPASATKTEYADVFLPNPTIVGNSSVGDGRTALDNPGSKTEGKDVDRTNETQKSVRVNGSYARLGKQVFGKQGTEDSEKLRQELQRQQEERLKRQQMRQERESRQNSLEEAEMKLLQLEEKQQQLLQQQQQSYGTSTPEGSQSSSETSLSPQQTHLPQAMKSRHYTMSSLVANSQDLPPLPLKKRHSMSSCRPSVPAVADPVLPPKQDKKLRSSLRPDRRTTSPPPPPPPPPTGSSTPSPMTSNDVSPHSTPRSPSPTSTALPKQKEVSPLSPSSIKTCEKSPFRFSKQPVPAPTRTSPPDPQTSLSPPPPYDQPSRSPSFPPPPPAVSDPKDSTPPIHTVTVNNHLSVDPQVERSPSPPLPPPPVESLTSPSMSSLSDFPPPPPTLLENTPDVDQTLSSPRQMGDSDSADDSCHLFPKSDSPEPGNDASLHPPASSQSYSGYEDMTRLKRTWTRHEVAADKKGYVMVNPVKRPESPITVSANPNASLTPLAVSSKLYENFIPLKTRHFEVRKLDGNKHSSSSDLSNSAKPEKPSRHAYENFEPSGSQEMKQEISGESGDTEQDSKDDSTEKSVSGTLPVLRVPPVPQVPVDPSCSVTNLRMREYDDLYDWLAQSKLLAYVDNFAEAGFDLPAMAGLTAEDLSEIQVTKTGHRKRLLSEATKLSMPSYTHENNVPSWLKSLGLSRYENHFIESGFDDIEFLYDLTKEDLEAIGVTKIGHRRKILMAAKKLQQRDNENQATNSNITPESETKDKQLPRTDVTTVGVTQVYADERVGDYAVPRVSHFAASKTRVVTTDERREFGSTEEQISFTQDFEISSDRISTESESKSEFVEEGTGNTYFTDEMNGNIAVEDSTDGVKELAASFQHAIHEETMKAKGRPPPVKPKSYKKPPPPLVAPKPKPNGVKISNSQQSPTDVNAKIDFTEVIKEAEALSESGSEQSPPSTLSRDRKSESGVSVDSSLAGSQGSLNSESDDFQREIKDTLHPKPSSGSSADDITKLTYLTLSQEDLLEQQKREEELEKFHKEQNKTDSLFNDIQGMLDNLNSELDDMFK